MIIAVVPQKVKGEIVRVGIVGFVGSIWVCGRKPKLATSRVNLNHVVALRIMQMTPVESRWKVTATSYTFIAEPTVVCVVLDVANSSEDELGCLVTLSDDSAPLACDLDSFARSWPELSIDAKASPLAGLYGARQTKGRKKRAVPEKKGDVGAGDGDAAKSKADKSSKKESEKKNAKGKSAKAAKAKKHGVDFKFAKKLKKAKEMITIKFAPENLAKSKTGCQLIENAMKELLALDFAKFANNPAFSKKDDGCNLNHPQCSGVPWSKIQAHAFAFFKLEPFVCAHMFSFFLTISHLFCIVLHCFAMFCFILLSCWGFDS